jgi:hypothetical protein
LTCASASFLSTDCPRVPTVAAFGCVGFGSVGGVWLPPWRVGLYVIPRQVSDTPRTGPARLVTPRSAPGRQKVGVEFLLVDSDGKILAALPSVGELPRELLRLELDPEIEGPVRVVRHDEYGGELAGASAFVTATPLPSLLRRSRTAKPSP